MLFAKELIMKKGFTLVELLITLMLVAVVIAITIPVMTNAISATSLRSNITLYKSAFKTAETIVGDLTSDLSLYPTGSLTNSTSAGYFCNNFSAKLNTIGTVACNSTASIPGTPNFTTTNGMRWYGLYNTFASNTTISVDIDGAGKGKNTSRVDILQIIITDQGKMSSPTGNETDYLQN
jgi:prepilin-type N-terminal cleavage/methylation domain-containing protein